MAQLLELIGTSVFVQMDVFVHAVQDGAPCTEAQGTSAMEKGPNSHLAQENTTPFLLTSWFCQPHALVPMLGSRSRLILCPLP